jgi:diguanylate cyclase (GGDEF)-like protein
LFIGVISFRLFVDIVLCLTRKIGFMNSFFAWIETVSKPIVLCLSAVMIMIVMMIDYFTGYDLVISVFYLVPIITFAYKFSLRSGVLICILCAMLWQSSNTMTDERFASEWVAVWNVFVKFGFFFFSVYILKSLQKSLKIQTVFAEIDALTGIMNRRSFYKRVQQEMERCKRFQSPVTVVYMDLDKFKQHNDLYGHRAGDAILVGFSNVLRNLARATDVPARLGGDEFAMLLGGTDQINAKLYIERVKAELGAHFRDTHSDISVSMGVYSTKTPMPVDEFLKKADEAMYQAKRSGGDCASYMGARA